MTDISAIVIEMQKLLRETYEQFNEKQYDDALANAVILKAAAGELVREMKQK
jgi:hypothetical protein